MEMRETIAKVKSCWKALVYLKYRLEAMLFLLVSKRITQDKFLIPDETLIPGVHLVGRYFCWRSLNLYVLCGLRSSGDFREM